MSDWQGAGFWNFCASLRLWKRVLVFLTLALGAVVLANTGWDVLPGVCSTIVPILCCVGGWEAGCTLLEGRKDWVRLWQTTLPLDTNSSIFYRRVFWLPWRSTSDKLHIFIWCLSHFHHHLCARGERDWWGRGHLNTLYPDARELGICQITMILNKRTPVLNIYVLG